MADLMDDVFPGEYDDTIDFGEAAPLLRTPFLRPTGRAPAGAAPSAAPLYQPRPTNQYVTQTQLATSMAKVTNQFKAQDAQTARIEAALRKEIQDRKTAVDSIQGGAGQSVQNMMLMSLLMKPKTQDFTFKDGNSKDQTITTISPDTSKFGSILPLLLLTQTGGGFFASNTAQAGNPGPSQSFPGNDMLMMFLFIKMMEL